MRRVDAFAVALLCAAAMALLWTKLPSLVYGDPAWWIHQTFRFAQGELPYRDFFWPYPPLSLAIFGTAARWFGLSFTVTQLTLNAVCLLIVLLWYRLAQRLYPGRLPLLACAFLIAVSITNQTYFSLFSFLTYGPSLHTAALGLLTLLAGLLRYADERRNTALAWIAAGANVSILAKQESILAAGAALLLLALFDRRDETVRQWLKRYLVIALLSVGPAALLYGMLIRVVGAKRLLDSLSGFGLAGIACPWWPTGVGLAGLGAALGLAAVMLAVTSLADQKRWRDRYGRRCAWLWVGAGVGLLLFALYEWIVLGPILYGPGPLMQKLAGAAPQVAGTSVVLRPVLWINLGCFAWLLWSGARNGFRLEVWRRQWLLLASVPAVISVRSLFGTHLVPYPEAPALAYPFLLLLGPYYLLRALQAPYGPAQALRASAHPRPVQATGAVMLAYLLLRLAGAYSSVLSGSGFTALDTEAGRVRVRDTASVEIYRYVMANTAGGDTVLELPDGGGINVTTRRRSPTYNSLFIQLPEPDWLQQLDAERVRTLRPEVVIAQAGVPHYGTYYGVRGTMGCPFPRLLWEPDRPSWQPDYVFPMVGYIQQNYRVDRVIGDWLLLRPKRNGQ